MPEFVVSRRLPSPPPGEFADGAAEDPDPDADAEGWLEVESGGEAETDDASVFMVLVVDDGLALCVTELGDEGAVSKLTPNPIRSLSKSKTV